MRMIGICDSVEALTRRSPGGGGTWSFCWGKEGDKEVGQRGGFIWFLSCFIVC